MNNYCVILFTIISMFAKAELKGQSQRYIVKLVTFNTRINDEFSPVFYKEGIVFCSNQRDNSLASYKDNQNRLFKIYYVEKKNNSGWKQPKMMAKEITTNFNDGPTTFNKNGDTMYYSRNNSIDNSKKSNSDTSNKLGIFSAELISGIWSNIKPFCYNNLLYSFSTPALAPDGKRIYFSSDMPGGKGGMDLYYCNKLNNEWDQPVNMGSVINTSKNELFPFVINNEKLFFASDGHTGFGGKDIFYSQEINGEWIVPVHLDSAINSTADDFGLATDSTFDNGYFSTNRMKTDDIFSFNTMLMEFANCDTVKENNFCYTFYDERQKPIDTIPLIYQWNFGNGIIRIGKEVRHCFSGSGEYSVKLSIIDKLTGKSIAEEVDYAVNLENIEQAYINSYNVGIVNQLITFDGTRSNLKGLRITNYLWNVGDGFKPGGSFMNTSFKKEGQYTIKMGLLIEKDSASEIPKICVLKKIRIYDTYQELALKDKPKVETIRTRTDSSEQQNKRMQSSIYFMDDVSERQKEKIEQVLKNFGKFDIQFNQAGIKQSSYPFLNTILNVLKENLDIHLEIVTHSIEKTKMNDAMEASEQWAQELSFYFKNNEIDMNAFQSKGYGVSNPIFKSVIPESKTIDGTVEFIFMKK